MMSYKDKYLKYKNKYLYLQKKIYGGASSAQLGATVILRNMVKELIFELEKKERSTNEIIKYNKLLNLLPKLNGIIHSNETELFDKTRNRFYDPTYTFNDKINEILDCGIKLFDKSHMAYAKLTEAYANVEISQYFQPTQFISLEDEKQFPSLSKTPSKTLSKTPSEILSKTPLFSREVLQSQLQSPQQLQQSPQQLQQSPQQLQQSPQQLQQSPQSAFSKKI